MFFNSELIIKAKAQGDSSPVRVWAPVFGFPPIIDSSLLRTVRLVVHKLIEVRELVNDVEMGIENLQMDQRFLEPIGPIRKVVDVSLSGMNQGMTGLLSDVAERHLAFLEVVALEWSRRNPDPEIDKEELNEVLKQTQELFAAVKSADDIPED